MVLILSIASIPLSPVPNQVSSLIKERKRVSVRVKHAELSMIHAYEELRVVRATRREEGALARRAERMFGELRDMEEKVVLTATNYIQKINYSSP